MIKSAFIQAAMVTFALAMPLGVAAQEVTPDNIAARAAQCYDAAETAAEKRGCVGAGQAACQAWLKASDPAYVAVPSEAVSVCAGAELMFWQGAVDRAWQGAGNLLDTIDAARLEENPDTPRNTLLTIQLDESQRAWGAYVTGFCGAKALTAVFQQREDLPGADCRLAKYGARAVELWQLGAMFE